MKSNSILWWLGVALLVGCSGGDDPAPGAGGSVGQAGGGGTSAAGAGGTAEGGAGGGNLGGTGGTGAGGTGGSSGSGGAAASAGSAGHPHGPSLVINEIYPSGDPADPDHPTDWVEIHNLGSDPVVLDGWVIAQDFDGTAMPGVDDQIPLTGQIPAGGFYVATTSNDAPGAMGSFGISTKKEERLTLFDPEENAVDDTTTDGTDTSKFEPGISWARFPDGTGPFARRAQTKAAANAE